MKNQIIALIIALMTVLLSVILLIINFTYFKSIIIALFIMIGLIKFILLSILQIKKIIKIKCGS